MLKKISIITVTSTVILLGGAFQTSVDASASSDQSQSQSHNKTYYSINGEWNNPSDYFNKYFSNRNNVNWSNNQGQEKEQSKQNEESNKVVHVEQPVKQEQVQQEQVLKEKQQSQNQLQQLSQFEQQVVELTNNERKNNGLSPLKADKELSRVAREKSNDMAANNYFAHNSPTYGSPFDMMQSYGINYRTAGENIAKGQRTPQEVVNAWMNSSGHRANILNGNFTHIGVGFVEQGDHWTQQFIGK